jgi:hypothetical protein
VSGNRVHDAVPKNFGRNVSILGSLSCHGMEAVMTVDGAVDAEVFRAYVRHVLVPTLHPGDMVVMDNPSVHKVHGIDAMVAAAGAQLMYLPPFNGGYPAHGDCVIESFDIPSLSFKTRLNIFSHTLISIAKFRNDPIAFFSTCATHRGHNNGNMSRFALCKCSFYTSRMCRVASPCKRPYC